MIAQLDSSLGPNVKLLVTRHKKNCPKTLWLGYRLRSIWNYWWRAIAQPFTNHKLFGLRLQCCDIFRDNLKFYGLSDSDKFFWEMEVYLSDLMQWPAIPCSIQTREVGPCERPPTSVSSVFLALPHFHRKRMMGITATTRVRPAMWPPEPERSIESSMFGNQNGPIC